MLVSMDATLAVGFRAGASCPRLPPPPAPTAPPPHCGCRPPRTLSVSKCSPPRRFLASDLRVHRKWCYRAGAVPGRSGSVPGPMENGREQGYHPSEEIGEPLPVEGEDARLSDAEMARTVIEVNSKAAVMFSGLIDDEVHENIIWPDLPYLTDEHGDIYFAVKDDEDVLKSLIADDKMVQVIIGLDNIEMLMEMGVDGPSNFDFGVEDMTSDESDDDSDDESDDGDDDYDEDDIIAILDGEEDDMISSETLSEWADSETLSSSHPMYFARKISEVVSNFHLDWMEQPSASIIIQGLLRPAFVEEQTFVRENQLGGNTINTEKHNIGEVVDDKTEDPDKDHSTNSHAVLYKLETINIQLVSAYGNQEVALSGVDSLGFDLRVCSGTQVQTLRFAFTTRATSEVSAEKQLRDLLFPRSHHTQQNRQQARRPKE